MPEERTSGPSLFDERLVVTYLHIQPPLQVVVGWKLVGQPVEDAADLPAVLLVQLHTKSTQAQSTEGRSQWFLAGSSAANSPSKGCEQPLHRDLKSEQSPGSQPRKPNKQT